VPLAFFKRNLELSGDHHVTLSEGTLNSFTLLPLASSLLRRIKVQITQFIDDFINAYVIRDINSLKHYQKNNTVPPRTLSDSRLAVVADGTYDKRESQLNGISTI
jgi:hypothetical protein